MAPDPIRTKPARRAAPPASRFTAAVFADLARRSRYVDPALGPSWGKIVGAEIAALCRPGRITGGKSERVLEIVAPNGAAAARAQFEAEAIRQKVNAYLGPGAIGRIAVRQAGGAPLPAATGKGRPGDGSLGAALGRFRASITRRKP
ncbi:MAG: DciA family protein [Amphiplicatus sp.]